MLTQETRWISSDPESKLLGEQDGDEAVDAINIADYIGAFDSE